MDLNDKPEEELTYEEWLTFVTLGTPDGSMNTAADLIKKNPDMDSTLRMVYKNWRMQNGYDK